MAAARGRGRACRRLTAPTRSRSSPPWPPRFGKFGLDVQLFEDLLSAFWQDVLVKRYETWADLLDYCRRSANPVGRLVLRVAGIATRPWNVSPTPCVPRCSSTNFWQDFAIDWAEGDCTCRAKSVEPPVRRSRR